MTYQSIPEGEVRLIPLQGGDVKSLYSEFVKRAKVTRDWFDANVYKCLPLAIANQYGFVVHAPYKFSFMWDGGPQPENVHVKMADNIAANLQGLVNVKPSFGRGIITIYPGFILKTAPNINLWVKSIPNHLKEGLTWLEGVVETDNLNSTFSYNIRIHEPNKWHTIEKGEPIGCFIPYPRFFFDDYKLNISEDEDEVLHYVRKNAVFGGVRANQLENGMYRKGVDFDGCPHHNHQITVNKPCKGE